LPAHSVPTTVTTVQHHDTLRSTTPQEVAVERAFARYDTDGNKCIDRTELASLCQQLGAPLTEGELGEAIQELDTDHSGMIEKGEFLTWWLDRDRKGANTGLRKKLSKVALTGARGGEWRRADRKLFRVQEAKACQASESGDQPMQGYGMGGRGGCKQS
jgi:hypothetical protein